MTANPDFDDITLLIEHARNGDRNAERRLCEQVFGELHEMAQRIMPHDDTSLQATMLVSDLFLKMFRKNGLKKTENRRYFFVVAADQMRNMMVDHYRRKNRQKVGGDRQRESLDVVMDSVLHAFEEKNKTDIESLNKALNKLKAQNDRQHQVVMHRFFGGLTVKQVADLLGVAHSTVERDWRLARAKLYADLNDPDDPIPLPEKLTDVAGADERGK